MPPHLIFDILTIFPHLLKSPLSEGIIRQAREKEQIRVHMTNIRDFALDKHQMTDDRPFGGGAGMVMKPEPLASATKAMITKHGDGKVILLSPQGRQLSQDKVKELAKQNHLILVCGRYEGVDRRFIDHYVDEEISIGDYVLTGGELGAMIIVDAVTRLLPGVLGAAESFETDTFSRYLLKHSQYTRPRSFEGETIPEVLLSGNHRKIEEMRFVESVQKTLHRRPDLLQKVRFDKDEKKLLKKQKLWNEITAICQSQDE